MRAFRVLLVAMTIGIYIYTVIVGMNYGWNIIPVITEGIGSLTWPGQFHLDFAFYLILSGIWLAWRHDFSVGGIVLGILGALLGMALFAPYLLIISLRSQGNVKVLVLGEVRAGM